MWALIAAQGVGRKRETIGDFVAVGGVAAISYGLALVYLPAGIIFAGVVALAVGVEWSKPKN